MKTFTVFFCGTGSNHLDFDLPRVDPETGAIDPSTSSYHAGELVSTLAAHHAGQEFVDWIVVDGPGSGNLREDEKWIEPGEYVHQWATATGAGWGENVQHALAVLKGEVVCDLDYKEDSGADVDMNLVMTGDGEFVEVQGSAEGKTFGRDLLNEMFEQGEAAIGQIFEAQRVALES